MSLKLEFIDGPLKGQNFAYPAEQQVVEIGRDPNHCHVVLPAELTAVGRRHMAIRQVGGRYRLATHPGNPVLIDGREPLDGEPLGRSQILTLGRNGPRIRAFAAFASALPETDTTLPNPTLSQRLNRQRRAFGMLAGLSLALAIGFGWFFVSRTDESGRIAALSGHVAELQRNTVSPEVLKRVSSSVYLVLVRNAEGEESTVGTAWVFDDGHLATNAHVAEAFDELESGQQLIARGTTAPFDAIAIDAVTLHPDYEAFRQQWKQSAPSRIEAGGALMELDAPGAGYDVALMRVAAGSRLAPPLPVADGKELDQLAAGTAVAFAGFPMEGLASGGVNPSAPIAQTQVGHITAVSDYFLLPSAGAERLLIQHAIPVTGGASGSPMVDGRGRVVGLISGMNAIGTATGRAPNAAGVNFAQRADLLNELALPRAPLEVAARRQTWAEGFASFDDPQIAVPRQLASSWLAELDMHDTPVALPAQHGALTPDATEEGMLVHSFDDLFSEPGHYLVLVMSDSRDDIDIEVTRGGETVAQDNDYNWYPSVMVTVTGSEGAETGLHVYMEQQLASEASDRPGNADLGFTLQVWRLPLQES